jgi:hypothetical protein
MRLFAAGANGVRNPRLLGHFRAVRTERLGRRGKKSHCGANRAVPSVAATNRVPQRGRDL